MILVVVVVPLPLLPVWTDVMLLLLYRLVQIPISSHVFRYGAQLSRDGHPLFTRRILRDSAEDVGLYTVLVVDDVYPAYGNSDNQLSLGSSATGEPKKKITRCANNGNVKSDTIKKVVDIAFLILTSKWRKKRFEKYACEIRKARVIA